MNNEIQSTTRWPLDYDSLDKGDMISVDRIEQITGTKHGTDAYTFSSLKLAKRIQSELHDRGRIWTVKSDRGALRILTDSEAAAYNHEIQVQDRRSMLRRFHLQQAVDTAQLTESDKQEHQRNLEIDGRFIQALLATRKELQLESSKRNVPGLPAD